MRIYSGSDFVSVLRVVVEPCKEIADRRFMGSADRGQIGNHAGAASTRMVPKEQERVGGHHRRIKARAGGGELCSPEGAGQADARGNGRD